MSKQPESRSPRVIHIVESLDRGAVENWLVRMMAHGHARGQTTDWTFYCQLEKPGERDQQVRDMGGRIVHSPVLFSQIGPFMAALRAELRNGRHEVMHCHHDLVSAVYIAASVGLPLKRFVHIHNADENLLTRNALKKRLLREPMRQICLSADKVVGISNHTLDTMLNGRARRPGRDVVHYYGIDSSPFIRAEGDRLRLRRSLGLAEDALILLFGGRITPEKNPIFAVDVLAALRQRETRAVAIFAGAGSLEDAVTMRARALAVEDNIRMIGWRGDLAEVMAACDWFILPRPEQPMEGFGLAVVEAQLAGLRMLLSRGIPDDPLLPTAVFRRLSLSQSAGAWADAALAMLNEAAPRTTDAISELQRSPMDMKQAFNNLLTLHETVLKI